MDDTKLPTFQNYLRTTRNCIAATTLMTTPINYRIHPLLPHSFLITLLDNKILNAVNGILNAASDTFLKGLFTMPFFTSFNEIFKPNMTAVKLKHQRKFFLSIDQIPDFSQALIIHVESHHSTE